MKVGDTIYNIFKNRTFKVKQIDINKNLVITDDMFFLFYDQCQVIKSNNDKQRQVTSGSSRGDKKE